MQSTDMIAFHSAHNYTLNLSDIRIVLENETLYSVPVGLMVLLSVFYGTISILAVIGNSLVIWIVVTTKQMQTITNMFIANLALADVTIGVFAIPFQFQAALLQRWNLPDFMCPFCPFVQLISVNVSVFTLTAIAVDRHRAIINPLRARTSKNISKFVISSIWVLSFALAAPILFTLRVRPTYFIVMSSMNETYTNATVPFCKFVNFELSDILMYRYVLVLVQYFIPLFVISFVYIQMAFRLWGSKTPGNAQDSRDMTMLKNKKKVIKMLIIVVALFGICWFPLQLYNILHVTWPDINDYRFINIIWFVCDWLAMSNSCYNPFIYGIYNEKFKREFRKRFPFKREGNYNHAHETDKTSSIFTRVSSIRSTYTTSSIRNKLSTNRYTSSGKSLPAQFKFLPPPVNHHLCTSHNPSHELAEGRGGSGFMKEVAYPAIATTTFDHDGDLGWDPLQQIEHTDRKHLRTESTGTVEDDDDYQFRDYTIFQGELAHQERTPLRLSGHQPVSNEQECTFRELMAPQHPHPDSGGESVDGEGKPHQNNSTSHLYCNDLEDKLEHQYK